MEKDFRGLVVGETRPEGLEQEGLHSDGLLPVGEGYTSVLVEIHLAQGHLDEIFNALILVLFQTLRYRRATDDQNTRLGITAHALRSHGARLRMVIRAYLAAESRF